MPQFSHTVLALSVLTSLSAQGWADDEINATTELETIVVSAQSQAASDGVVHNIQRDQLQQAATTLGQVLEEVAGVSSSSFGAGASRPVIRGQDGARVKMISNASDTMDVSSLSPDHVVTIDPQLSEQIELIRGPASLMYAAGSVGGLVNVKDSKIATQMPEQGYEGSIHTRYNSGNDERLANAAVTLALGDQFAMRVEGLTRNANHYIVPDYTVIEEHGDHQHQLKQRRVNNTFAQSDAFNIGLSWIGDRGFAGVAYSQRKDQYGLPGHSHEYESCHLDDLVLHCGAHDAADEDHEHTEEGHDHAGPWIDLKSERYDFRSELEQPFSGFERLGVQAGYTRYHHDEIEQQQVATRFESKAYDARVELDHADVAGWTGTWGMQASQQKLDLSGEEAIMAPTKTQKYSLFALEKTERDALRFELSGRIDHQRVDIDSEQNNFDATAYSASAASYWDFKPDYTLSLSASHQQRLPLAQELYSDGKHFATNTYELGNERLSKEKSNNLELGFKFDNQTLNYAVNLYHNWFDDYIYAQTLDRYQDFRLIEYRQSKAKFYGAEAHIGYQLNPIYKVGLMGDYVRGKIEQDNAPRVPAGRIGTQVEAQFDQHWKGQASLYHVFEQDKVSAFEHATGAYQMLNMGLSYTGQLKSAQQYQLYFNANNLLDAKVYQHASFLSNIPQMGRHFVVGMQYKF